MQGHLGSGDFMQTEMEYYQYHDPCCTILVSIAFEEGHADFLLPQY